MTKKERDELADETGQIICWCMAVAMHQKAGIARLRLDKAAGALEQAERMFAGNIALMGYDAARKTLMQEAAEYLDPEFRWPRARMPKGAAERELYAERCHVGSCAWCLFGSAIHESLGWGRERLGRLKEWTVENVAQWEQWVQESRPRNAAEMYEAKRYANEKLMACATLAMKQTVAVVDDDNPQKQAEVDDMLVQFALDAMAANRAAMRDTNRTAAGKALAKHSALNVLAPAAREEAVDRVLPNLTEPGIAGWLHR